MRKLIKLCKDQRGATAVEYGLIVALIFLAVVGGVSSLGGNIGASFQRTLDAISKVM